MINILFIFTLLFSFNICSSSAISSARVSQYISSHHKRKRPSDLEFALIKPTKALTKYIDQDKRKFWADGLISNDYTKGRLESEKTSRDTIYKTPADKKIIRCIDPMQQILLHQIADNIARKRSDLQTDIENNQDTLNIFKRIEKKLGLPARTTLSIAAYIPFQKQDNAVLDTCTTDVPFSNIQAEIDQKAAKKEMKKARLAADKARRAAEKETERLQALHENEQSQIDQAELVAPQKSIVNKAPELKPQKASTPKVSPEELERRNQQRKKAEDKKTSDKQAQIQRKAHADAFDAILAQERDNHPSLPAQKKLSPLAEILSDLSDTTQPWSGQHALAYLVRLQKVIDDKVTFKEEQKKNPQINALYTQAFSTTKTVARAFQESAKSYGLKNSTSYAQELHALVKMLKSK